MKSINHIRIETILFLDIETAPNWQHFKDVPKNVRTEWIYKFKFRPEAPKPISEITTENENYNPDNEFFKNKEIAFEKYYSDLWNSEAGLHAEFSRVVCVSAGFMYQGDFYLRSYTGLNEGELLNDFKTDLEKFEGQVIDARICAHYGKGFDFPYLGKRMLINRIKIPKSLDSSNLKPWEQLNLDTQEIWKLGGFNSAGLPALCMAFGLETPKDDLDGSKVSAAFHAGDIDRIALYCEKDVVALINVFKAMRLEEPINKDKIIIR